MSFKLETDHEILLSKARHAIGLYDMDIVVANELETRYQRVFLVSKNNERTIEKVAGDEELEVPLVKTIIDMHHNFIQEKLFLSTEAQ